MFKKIFSVLISFVLVFTAFTHNVLADDSDKESTRYTTSTQIYFDIYQYESVSGTVYSTSHACGVSFYQTTRGSAHVIIYEYGVYRTEFDIPSVGYTSVYIPFSCEVIGDPISYIVTWKSGGYDGKAVGSFTLYY